MTLYQIDARLAALEQAEAGEIIDPETGEVVELENAIERLQLAREEKLENIALWCKNLAAEAAAIKVEEESLMKRRKAAEGKLERLKGYLVAALTHADGTADKFRTARASITVRLNPPKLICDEEQLPEEFKLRKLTIVPDASALKEVLGRGIDVPGARLERGRSVMIR